MVIFSLIIIAAFCIIQVKNQLSSITTFNLYRARVSALIVKDTLEKTIKEDALAASTDIRKSFQISILSLKESGIIENVVILNKNCEFVATSGKKFAKLAPADYRIVKECADISQKNKWLIPNIDTQRSVIDLYIPLALDGNVDYIAKVMFSLGNIGDALRQVYIPIIITVVIVIFLNIILGSILTKTIVRPIKVLNEATKAIAGGNLKLKVNIKTRDEIEELGGTFNYMTDSLQRMKEKAENANPLTKLPGNNIIHEETSKRINANRKFIFIYADLDYFKAYNDKYGIAEGDKVIKLTADIMRESLKFGGPDIFLGHEGGDDFVLIVSPANAEKVTAYIINEFDKRVRDLYTKEDLQQGFIISTARDGTIQKFPIMSISLAGVSNEKRPLASYGETTNICTEVKKKAKSVSRSIFILDKRMD
ncbi:MAG: HAMP domain-containing protein [Candidatus Omnitrophica bacterium]|nr:HAMP domain-containing protein [Candidatus Omnitrophota bacterium]